MELVYTDAKLKDVGMLVPASADFAWGASENSFSISLYGEDIPERGALIYVEGSDIGGIVTGYESRSNSKTVNILGVTWTGVIAQKLLQPDNGQAYFTVSGDVRDCVDTLIHRFQLASLFVVDSAKTGVTVNHTFSGRRKDQTQQDAGRYMSGWAALWQLLSEHDCKVRMWFDGEQKRVVLKVLKARDFTDDESLLENSAVVKVTNERPINHLVCLGSGEMEQRSRADVYLDKNGNASRTQYFTGINEVIGTYEDTQHAGEELYRSGLAKIQNLMSESQAVSVMAASDTTKFDLGDVVGNTDLISGVQARAIVSKKIAKLKRGHVSFEYTTTTL